MLTTIDSTIKALQSEGVLPQGHYEYSAWEQRFSLIYCLTISPSSQPSSTCGQRPATCNLQPAPCNQGPAACDSHTFFLKKLKPRSDYSEKDILRMLVSEYKALKKLSPFFSQHEHFNIPNPVYFSGEELLLITESLKGTQILDIGRAYASRRGNLVPDNLDALKIYSGAGKFLRLLHDSEFYPYSRQDLNRLADSIKERLTGGIFTKAQETGITEYLEYIRSELSEDLHQYKKNPIHKDFTAENVLYDGDDINVLDFGDYRIDHAFQDLSYFKLMLRRQLESRIKYRKSAAEELIRAFNKGYGLDDAAISTDKLYHLYRLKNLAIFVKTLASWKDEWQGLSPGFIKDKILNSLEYHKIKKQILECTGI
jgi:hypothetical protein